MRWRLVRFLAPLLLVILGVPWADAPATAIPAWATPSPAAVAQSPAVVPPPPGECRAQSAGERPRATADDIANCVYTRLGQGRVRLAVAYTYASSLGKQNIWLGVDVLAEGNRLKWFGYRPVPITGSSGTAAVELIFGVNDPPTRSLITDQIEFFMYVGGGQIFYRKMFALKLDWQR
jgi:hypothetical protein